MTSEPSFADSGDETSDSYRPSRKPGYSSELIVQAAVLEAFGQPLLLEDVEIDGPTAEEVLVRTVACGICYSDLAALRGDSPRASSVPVVLGHEASGIVEQIGAAVSAFGVGDSVVVCAAAGCGKCVWCLQGFDQHCVSPQRSRTAGERPRLTRNGDAVDAFVGVGGFASHMLVHERALVKIPKEMPHDRAALLGCAVHTAFGAVRYAARVALGDTVAVIGCGGVGLNIIQAAIMAGASKVIAIDIHPHRLFRARTFGATDVIDASIEDVVTSVGDLTSGGVDFAFEAVGRSATVAQACAITRKRGTITVIGLPPRSEMLQIPSETLFDEKRLLGTKMGQRFQVDIPWYCRMYLAGRLQLDELISQSVLLHDVNSGLDALESTHGARTVLTFPAGG